MRTRVLLALLLASATRAASALTCGGFSIVPADHVIVKYSTPLPAGATYSLPFFSRTGSDMTITRTVSGGSAIDTTCVDQTIDFGVLEAGRYNLSWSDESGSGTRTETFTFFVGTPLLESAAVFSGFSGVVPLPLPDQPVRLEINVCSPHIPVASFSGTDIRVSFAMGTGACSVTGSFIDLGVLPPATYNVTTTLSFSDGRLATETFSFIVQHPPASTPCDGTFSMYRTWAGTTHLHFEDTYQGYAPTFAPPMVAQISVASDDPANASGNITIVQPVIDIADSTRSGTGTPSGFCHGEDLDLGVLPEASYSFNRYDQVTAADVTSPLRLQDSRLLVYFDGSMQCGLFPPLLATATAIEGVPFEASLAVINGSPGFVRKVAVEGNTVTIDVETIAISSGPGSSVRSGCTRFKATVPPLPAGDYTLMWRGVSPFGATPAGLTTHFTVIKAPRTRSARQ